MDFDLGGDVIPRLPWREDCTGHVRLDRLPRLEEWRDVVELIATDAPMEPVAEASERDLSRATDDRRLQSITSLPVRLAPMARAPGFETRMAGLGVGQTALGSVTRRLSGLDLTIDPQGFESGGSFDAGELAKSALLESLSVQLRDRLPTLFEPTPQEIRAALGGFAQGDRFAALAPFVMNSASCR